MVEGGGRRPASGAAPASSVASSRHGATVGAARPVADSGDCRGLWSVGWWGEGEVGGVEGEVGGVEGKVVEATLEARRPWLGYRAATAVTSCHCLFGQWSLLYELF